MASNVTEAPTCVATEQCLPSTSPPWRLEEASRASVSNQIMHNEELEREVTAPPGSTLSAVTACASKQIVCSDELEQEDTALAVEPSTVTEPPVGFGTELADLVATQHHPSLGPVTTAITLEVEIPVQPMVNYVQVGEPRQVGWYVSERINISPEEYARLTAVGAVGKSNNSHTALANNQAEHCRRKFHQVSKIIPPRALGSSKVKAAVVRRKSRRCC